MYSFSRFSSHDDSLLKVREQISPSRTRDKSHPPLHSSCAGMKRIMVGRDKVLTLVYAKPSANYLRLRSSSCLLRDGHMGRSTLSTCSAAS